MSLKLLGKADLSATTNTSVYTVGSGKEALVNVNGSATNISVVVDGLERTTT